MLSCSPMNRIRLITSEVNSNKLLLRLLKRGLLPIVTAVQIVKGNGSGSRIKFSEFDKVGESDAQLHSQNFGMGKPNPKKTLTNFLPGL